MTFAPYSVRKALGGSTMVIAFTVVVYCVKSLDHRFRFSETYAQSCQ